MLLKFLSRKFLMPIVFYLLTGTTKNLFGVDNEVVYIFAGLTAFYILVEGLKDLKQNGGANDK